MQRRELFRLLGGGAMLPALDGNVLAMLQEAQPKSDYKIRTLNPHQNATLVIMTDIIIPETDTPGAKAVKVNEFIDLIMTEWAHEEERQRFLAGFEEVDKRCNALFGKDFVDASPAQQEEIVRYFDYRATEARANLSAKQFVRHPHDNQLDGSFFEVVKHMTLYGYYTSEVGFTQELKKQIIPGAYHGCTPVSDTSKA